MDQAVTLRRLANGIRQHERQARWPVQPGPVHTDVKVLSFTSGKGGVGKTHIVVNLAYALQCLGARVMLLDADLGLANVDVLLGLAPRFTIQHVSKDTKHSMMSVTGPAGMLILPAGSGVPELAELNDSQRLQLLTVLETLDHDIDFLLIDTGAGISANVMYFNVAAQDIVVVVTPEPTSITDAYALMKVLSTKYDEKHFKVIMNNVTHATEAKDAFRRLNLVTERFLNISIDYLGFIPHDISFSRRCASKALLVIPGNRRRRRALHLPRWLSAPEMVYQRRDQLFGSVCLPTDPVHRNAWALSHIRIVSASGTHTATLHCGSRGRALCQPPRPRPDDLQQSPLHSVPLRTPLLRLQIGRGEGVTPSVARFDVGKQTVAVMGFDTHTRMLARRPRRMHFSRLFLPMSSTIMFPLRLLVSC
jgi:flagellar biosynthesis protein FlhG